MMLSRGEVAAAFSCTSRTIGNWTAAGFPTVGEGRDRKYPLARCIVWRLARERDAGGDAGEAYRHGRARLTGARAEAAELANARVRGELMPVQDVLQKVRTPLEAVDLKLRTAPGRMGATWARRLKVTQAEAMALLRDLVEDVRSDLRSVFAEPAEGGTDGR